MCCHTHQCAEYVSAVIHTNVLQIPQNFDLQIKPCSSKLSSTDCDCIYFPTDVDQPSLTCPLGHAERSVGAILAPGPSRPLPSHVESDDSTTVTAKGQKDKDTYLDTISYKDKSKSSFSDLKWDTID